MNTTILVMISFILGICCGLANVDQFIDMEEQIVTAYMMGVNECPEGAVCIHDGVGLVRPSFEELEGML